MQVTIPEPSETDDFTPYLAKISPLIEDATARRIATVVHLYNHPSFGVLQSLTTQTNAPQNSDPTLITFVDQAGNLAQRHRSFVTSSQDLHQKLLSPWLNSVINLKHMASSENGTAAQMVKPSDGRYHYESPFSLSDADTLVGIALLPAKEVSFDTTEVIKLSASLQHLCASIMESSIKMSER